MTLPGRRKRVLIYSHDSFGLGHLRRCRAIAQGLVAADPELSVLILSGSPIIGRFDFGERVDFVRIPGIIKLANGEYTTLALGIDLEQTLAMREAIIRHTALAYAPDLFIVDKEPLGLRGEVRDTLALLRGRGCPVVLGLRDVLDDPAVLADEWRRKGAVAALAELYDEIWVYGLPQICDPLDGLELPPSVPRKTVFTGYLRRPLPVPAAASNSVAAQAFAGDARYLLVTAGGGGDGDAMLDWVLRAYESGAVLPFPPLFVLGPFMPADRQQHLRLRIQAVPEAAAITFDAYLETLIDRAAAVVTMGGYNTFCEVLSFDKPALIVPREQPRQEQRIRAERASSLGLAAVLRANGPRATDAMITALRQLGQQAPPSTGVVPGLLDGIENVQRLARRIMGRTAARLLPIAAAGG
ncbi:MAG: glycosyltransferase family protein [Alphaproteobacteria bacterium]